MKDVSSVNSEISGKSLPQVGSEEGVSNISDVNKVEIKYLE